MKNNFREILWSSYNISDGDTVEPHHWTSLLGHHQMLDISDGDITWLIQLLDTIGTSSSSASPLGISDGDLLGGDTTLGCPLSRSTTTMETTGHYQMLDRWRPIGCPLRRTHTSYGGTPLWHQMLDTESLLGWRLHSWLSNDVKFISSVTTWLTYKSASSASVFAESLMETSWLSTEPKYYCC